MTNISTRGILRRLESTEIRFWPGLRSGSSGGPQNAPSDPIDLIGWGAPQTIKCYGFPIIKRLLTEHQFTTNISTRGILLRLESTVIRFRRGSAPDPAGGAQDAPQTLVGWGGETHPHYHPLDAFGV